MNPALASVLALAFAAATTACSREEGEMPVIPAQPSGDTQSTPGAPAKPPPPDVPTGAAPELPKPGQNNDHSSPAFRGEAASMPQKK